MLEPYTKTLVRAGRFGAAALAAVLCLLGAWMLLNPSGARSVWRDLGAYRDAGGSGPIALAAGVQNGGYFRLGTEFANAVQADGHYTLNPVETNGSPDNLKRLRDGQVNFALLQGDLLGNPTLSDGDSSALVLPVANVDRQYLHLIVPADSPIHTLRDLAGKRIAVGPAGSGHEALAQLVFKYYAFATAPTLVTDHVPDLNQAFQDGSIDAAFAIYSLFSPAVEELFNTSAYRLVPVPEAEALARFIPGIYAEDLPPGLYGPERNAPPAIDGPFPTLMVNTFLVARRDAPPSQVRALLEALYSPGFRYRARLVDLDEQHGRISPLAPLQSAAAAWYARREPLSTDRFEVASFFLAGLVTLASTIQYLIGRRHWIRALKSRRAIRQYFERLLEYGAAVEATSDTTGLSAILHDMMATQREAETEWLAGRLDTEHMENLYLIYNTRTRNAFDKIHQLHLQALIEGGPLPATYRPEPARPVFSRPAVESPRPTIFDAPAPAYAPASPEPEVETAREVSQDHLPVSEAPMPAPAPAPVPQKAPSGIGVPRVRTKKDRGHHGSPAATPSPAPSPPVAPRQLSEWEVEQKYQRSSDTVYDMDSGIVSPPRPRRKVVDDPAPARATIDEEPASPTTDEPPQRELF